VAFRPVTFYPRFLRSKINSPNQRLDDAASGQSCLFVSVVARRYHVWHVSLPTDAATGWNLLLLQLLCVWRQVAEKQQRHWLPVHYGSLALTESGASSNLPLSGFVPGAGRSTSRHRPACTRTGMHRSVWPPVYHALPCCNVMVTTRNMTQTQRCSGG